MRPHHTVPLLLLAALALGAAGREEQLQLTGFVPPQGFELRLGAGAVPAIEITKTSPERRLLAGIMAPVDLAWARTIIARGRGSGELDAARLAAVLTTGDNAWFALGQPIDLADGAFEAGLDLARLRPTAYSADPTAEPSLTTYDSLWLGLVIDGPADARLEQATLSASDEPLRVPPLTLDPAAMAAAPLPHDGDLTMRAALDETEPDVGPVLRLDYDFAHPRHLYGFIAYPLEVDSLASYRSLRITYRAHLPAGVSVLLALQEQPGGQYVVAAPPPTPADSMAWQTVVVPLNSFELGSWSQDGNNRLDLDGSVALQFGAHGTANPPGEGTVWLAEVTLLP